MNAILAGIATAAGIAVLICGYLHLPVVRRRMASETMRRIMAENAPNVAEGGDYVDWSHGRSKNGGIGVITYARGSVQAFLKDGVYTVHWFGRQGHPVKFERVDTRDHAEFVRKAEEWAHPNHVHRRDPEGHAHGMLI